MKINGQNGRQEIDLPLPRQGSGGDRQENGAERLQGLRERDGRSERTARRPETRNRPRQLGES